MKTPTSGCFTDYLSPQPENSAFFAPTTPKEIENLCQGLDPSKGPGHDGFAPSIFRLMASELSIPLSKFINICIEAGHFPNFLKMARITSVFKKGDPTQFGNYRPISVLSVLSKIFERIIQVRLSDFLVKQGSIYQGQYGFRRGHSTSMAITDLVERVHTAWQNGFHSFGIFIDLRKAFDTVDHTILLTKLEHLGIRGTVLQLFRTHLEDRKQFVVFGNSESPSQAMEIGVPKGSILGPLLFIIYVNDLPNASAFFAFILFADDTNNLASERDKKKTL